MKDWIKISLATALILLVLGGCSYVSFFPSGRALWNTYDNTMKKVDDRTRYESRKKVEDTCRASIASYKTDKETWKQYKDSESELERSWASQAKMRANKTANIYNEYMMKNSYVFDGNVPADINIQLAILD